MMRLNRLRWLERIATASPYQGTWGLGIDDLRAWFRKHGLIYMGGWRMFVTEKGLDAIEKAWAEYERHGVSRDR